MASIFYRAGITALVILAVFLRSADGLTCSACQGTLGQPCDVAPWTVATPIPCEGRCMTWRSLYSIDRGLRTIWRGCDKTLMPAVLSSDFKDTCSIGNFFVECTRTCNSNMCNTNHTGIPDCWSCHGDHRDCYDYPPTQCEEPVITTPLEPVRDTRLECVRCQGGVGSDCDIKPYKSPLTVFCDDECVTWKHMFAYNRTMIEVWRGCKGTLFPNILHPSALNSCDSSADITFIECSSTCDSSLCNKYSTGFSECWTDTAERISDCASPTQATIAEYATDLPTEDRVPVDEIPPTQNITCTICQGVEGDPCDVSPHEITTSVSCAGNCVVNRKLYATGRALRSVWRGCDTTLFPHILGLNFKNACQYGNFFVDCTRTCRTGNFCNQNYTGIPRCWDCLGDKLRACDLEPEPSCAEPEIVTTTREPREITCMKCAGGAGSDCDIRSHSVTTTETCYRSCISLNQLRNDTRELIAVWRGCDASLPNFAKSQDLNTCVESGDTVNCMTSCYETSCNKYTLGIPECWDETGVMTPECRDRPETTPLSIFRSPSRFTTKRPYQIQDAYGGDNFRGNWRPPENSSWEEYVNPWSNWRYTPYYKSRNNSPSSLTLSVTSVLLATCTFITASVFSYN